MISNQYSNVILQLADIVSLPSLNVYTIPWKFNFSPIYFF